MLTLVLDLGSCLVLLSVDGFHLYGRSSSVSRWIRDTVSKLVLSGIFHTIRPVLSSHPLGADLLVQTLFYTFNDIDQSVGVKSLQQSESVSLLANFFNTGSSQLFQVVWVLADPGVRIEFDYV